MRRRLHDLCDVVCCGLLAIASAFGWALLLWQLSNLPGSL